MPTSSAAPLADQRLLNLLVRRGKIDKPTASAAERSVVEERSSAVEALEAAGSATEAEIASMLATELRLPLVDLKSVPFNEGGTDLVDEPTANRFQLVPIRVQRDLLVVAMANPLDQEAIRHVEFSTGRRVRPAVALRSQVAEAIGHVYKREGALGALLADVPAAANIEVMREEADTGTSRELQSVIREAEEPPIVKMVNLILLEAFNAKASDVHIEPGPNTVVVRYRVNGILEDTLQIPKWVHGPVIARIKVMSKLDITERRVPQDGHLSVRHRDQVVDVRVSSLPTTYGEKIVMRILDPSIGPRRLEDIGLSTRDLETVRRVIQRPEGMILVTGPTGSGKTTTLYAVLQDLVSSELNIVTIENPVEYQVKGITQVEVNEKQGLTFAGVLRSVLRQDPDVILIGEIRDRETAQIAFQAAQTGHLVLSTVHTNDTTATITRLVDLGVEPYIVGPSLLAVVAQRLVRSNCPSCSAPATVEDATARTLGIHRLDGIRRGRGCANCRKSGFAGRTGCYEVLAVSRRVQQLIEQKAPESAVRVAAEEEGMTSLRADAIAKIESGVTTPEEVVRVVQFESRGPSCPSCAASVEDSFTICPYCRTALRLTCPSCNVTLKKEWTSCPFCGTDVKPGDVRPAAPPPIAEPLAAAAKEPPAKQLGRIDVPKILVVDDHDDVRDLVRRALLKSPFPLEVELAANGPEALAKVESNRPHLIVLDIMMPGMDGYEVCQKLRADLKTALIPILMLTARDDAESKRLGFLAGTDDYVVKPFDRAELLARVQRLLQRAYGFAPGHVEEVVSVPAGAPAA
jgi:type IV pilus assembly protein PilB